MKRSFFKLLSGIIFFPIYLVSNLIPRSSKIWVFGAWFGNNYSDNPSYIYEYIINKKLPIDAIWLTNCNIIINDLRVKGFRVYHKFSIYGLWYGSRAGVTFINCGYDDVNKYCISGSLIVQLWHGIPLKKIKNDDLINQTINKNFFLWIKQIIEKCLPYLSENYDLVVSSNPLITDRLQSAFNIKSDNIIETGYPRMDIILSSKFAYNKSVLKGSFSNKTEKYILYAPTHRSEGKKENNIFSYINFDKTNEILNENKSILIIKLHYYELDKLFKKNDKEYSNIHFINKNRASDINRILYNIDLLITDYSSVFYDYLVLDRPIIFFPFDLDKYQKIDRALYQEYNSEVPGPICHDWNMVIDQLKIFYLDKDLYKANRKKIFKKYFLYSDSLNSKRIIENINKKLNILN